MVLDCRSRIFVRIIFVCLCTVLWTGSATAALRYSGTWEVQENGDGRLLQNNRQYAAFSLDQAMTDRLSVDESVVYGYSWQEGVGVKETVSPSLGVLLDNDLFSLDFGGSRIDELRNPGVVRSPLIIDTAELRWTSKWDMSKVPDLSFGMSQRSNKDDFSPHLTDNQTRNYNSTLGWDLGLVSINYNHSRGLITDKVLATEDASETQQARLSGDYRFWDDRLRLSISHEYQDNNYDRETRANAFNLAIINRVISEVRTGVDDPADLIELTVANVNPQMIDNDLVTSAYTIAGNTINHTVLMAVNAQAVNVVYLYAPDNWGGGVPSDLVNWRVYSANFLPPAAWNNVAITGPITYDSANQRLEIPILTVSQNYLKVVVDRNITALPVIDLAEVSVAQVTTAASGTIVQTTLGTTSNASNLGVKFRLNRDFMLNYNFSTRVNEDTNGLDDERLSQLVSVDYRSPDQTFSSSVSYGDSLATLSSSGSEQESKNFGLTMNKNILPTLDVEASGSRHDFYDNGQRKNQNDQYNFNINAQLYPDLSSNVALTHRLNKAFDTGDDRDTSEAQLSITSRLRPSFTLSLNERYEETNTNNIQTSESTISLLNWSWQLSEFLTNNGGLRSQNNKYDHNTYSFDTSLNAVLNRVMQVTMNYVWQDDETKVTQTARVDWRWTITRHLRLKAGANYFEQEGVVGNNIMFFSELSADFSIR